MPKNDFESTNFANFVEVVHNFGRSDVAKKMFIFNTCRLGLMPNLIKNSWTVSNQGHFDLTHGTPFRRAVEDDLLDNTKVFQIGIRG